jgi:hypothetical protein
MTAGFSLLSSPLMSSLVLFLDFMVAGSLNGGDVAVAFLAAAVVAGTAAFLVLRAGAATGAGFDLARMVAGGFVAATGGRLDTGARSSAMVVVRIAAGTRLTRRSRRALRDAHIESMSACDLSNRACTVKNALAMALEL